MKRYQNRITSIALDDDTRAKLVVLSARRFISRSALVRELIDREFERETSDVNAARAGEGMFS